MNLEESKIAIIGLGYVGLPLAVAFAKKYKVIGFDTNSKRINELQKGNDSTREINKDLLDSVLDNKNIKSIGLNLTVSDSLLKSCNIFIITVPTPIDKKKKPDLSMMLKASETVASFLNGFG